MNRRCSAALGWVALLLLIFPLGCARSNGFQVSLKLLQGGTPYAPPAGQRVVVTLYAVDGKDRAGTPLAAGEPFPASLDPSAGAFVVPGPDGAGIPPGKYRVSIFQGLTREAENKANQEGKLRVKNAPPISRDTDMLKDMFGPTTSPIVREVKAAGEITIDLDSEMPQAKKDAEERAKKARQQRQGAD